MRDEDKTKEQLLNELAEMHRRIDDIENLDIARTRAEVAMRENEERMRKAQAIAHVGNWEIDLRTRKVWGSEEAFRIYGIDRSSEFLPVASVQECVLPQYREGLDEALRELISEGKDYDEEFQIRRVIDGKVRYLHAKGEQVLDEAGMTVKVAGVIQDITVHKNAEETLRRYELLSDHSRDIILFVRRDDGHILEANAAATNAYGYTRNELLTLAIHDLRALHTQGLTADQMAEAAAHGILFETVHRRKDGTTFPVEVSSRGAAIGDRHVLISMVRDITKRREAEKTLHEAHERAVWLARFPEENPNPVVRVSTDGSILYCNPAAADAHSWACEVGKPLPPSFLPLVRQAMAEDQEVQQDVELGGRFYFVWVAPFLGDCYANVYGRDITERKRAEEALQKHTLELKQLTETLETRVQGRTAELKNANQALRHLSSRLLSIQEEERKKIASDIHDTFGASLSAIKIRADSVLQELEQTDHPATRSLKSIMPLIQESIEECRRMQMDLRPSALDDLGLLATISWFCRRFQTIYPGIRVEQEINIQEDEVIQPLKVVAFRVIQEAMNNIAKHSRASLARLSLRKPDGRLELVVQDNGRGFSPERALTVESLTRGLGLTSMRERVEFSGGSFSIESREGAGTVIRASWPLP
jgi:PAS domain S-box-containing protein